MKLAISTNGTDLTGQVDQRFGRCKNFLVIETDTMEYEVIPNTAVGAAHGAGIAAVQFIASLNVEAILTGNVGPNAFSALSASGIQIITGVSGNVAEAVKRFNSGEYKSTKGPTVEGHFGTGGRGRGGGRRRF